jgi:hypothetical protein
MAMLNESDGVHFLVDWAACVIECDKYGHRQQESPTFESSMLGTEIVDDNFGIVARRYE